MSKKPKVTLPIGKLFGLTKDPVKKADMQCYFLITATVDEYGDIIEVTKSEQSWFLWEALHKQERASEEWLMHLQSAKTGEMKR